MRIAEHSADLIRLASMAIAVVLSVTGAWKFLTSFDLIALAATIIGGYPMAKEAFEAIRKRRMTMELSMSIAVLATLMVGQFLTGLVITLFVLIAELLEDLTVTSGRNVSRLAYRCRILSWSFEIMLWNFEMITLLFTLHAIHCKKCYSDLNT